MYDVYHHLVQLKKTAGAAGENVGK